MTRLANLLAASGNSASKQRLDRLLAETHGLHVVEASLGPSLGETARQGSPDVAIIAAEASQQAAIDAARGLKRDPATAPVPIAWLCGDASPAVFVEALAVGIDEVFVGSPTPDEFLARLRPLMRLATMQAELARRGAIARAFGVANAETTISATVNSAPYSLLAVGAGADAIAVRALGARVVVATAAPMDIEARLGERRHDGCLLAPAPAEVAAHLEACAHLRNNPSLFNLPLVLLLPAGGANTVSIGDAHAQGASRVLSADCDDAEIGYALETLCGRQRRRHRLREAIATSRDPATLDADTPCYRFAFLERHLASLIDGARLWGKPLTAVFFSIPTATIIRQEFGEDAAHHLIFQLAQWIIGLVRVEDAVARYGDHDFCVALPDTPLAEAHQVMKRIAGILSYTDFALPDVYQPVSVPVEVGLAELRAGDDVQSLIARAHGALE